MKKILLILLVACTSCTNLQNICFSGKQERLSGEVLYAVPKTHFDRTVVLIINDKKVVIYRVPNEQPLYNGGCYKLYAKIKDESKNKTSAYSL